MEKLDLNFNQLLRVFFSGVWGIAWFLFLSRDILPKNSYDDGLKNATSIILLAMTLGAVIYSIHRAIMYPFFYRLILFGLGLFKKVKLNFKLLVPFILTKTEMDLDFKRWKRLKNKESISNNLAEWGAQIHFLYCSTWSLLLAILISKELNYCITNQIGIAWITFFVILSTSVIHNIRYMLYDLEIEKHD